MRRTNTITKFHPKAPRKLIKLYKDYGGNCYKLGKHLEINASHIWQLLKHGREPKREDLRVKLFLKVQRKSAKVEVPEHIRLWRKLSKAERDKVVQQYINWRKKSESTNQRE